MIIDVEAMVEYAHEAAADGIIPYEDLQEVLEGQLITAEEWEAWWRVRARNYVLHGGRASGKSWAAAHFCIFLATHFKVRFLCVRQFQNSIKESVYTLLKDRVESRGLREYFDFQKSTILVPSTGSEFLFFGLARNLDEIKSTEGVDICWVEEAQSLTKEQFDILNPTIRKDGSIFLIVFNPQYRTDFVYRRFVLNPPPSTRVMQVNHYNNPYLSQSMKDIIAESAANDPVGHQNIYLGVPMEDNEKVIIKRHWIEAAVDSHIKLGRASMGYGISVCGFDVADAGEDFNATIVRKGSVALSSEMFKGVEDEIGKSAGRAYNTCMLWEADLVFDGIGVGAFVGGHITLCNLEHKDSREVGHTKFVAGGSVLDPDDTYIDTGNQIITNGDYFSNVKSQAWMSVADRFRNTYDALSVKPSREYADDELISISSAIRDLEKLTEELSSPFKDVDNNGRMLVESKKLMLKREIKSPNLADAFIMSFWSGGSRGGFFDM